jgi:tRNA1(Val) A37 N6-methylase TrmN6
VLPIHARPNEPAIRVIVQGTKGSKAPLAVLPAFVLHDDSGAFSPGAQAILRHGGALEIAG